MQTLEDRRRRRSADPLVALHYQLSYTRTEASLETVVLADGSGVVVAGAGAWAACEELAAYAPLLLQGATHEQGRIAELRERVTVRAVQIDGEEVLLCALASSSDDLRRAALGRAAVGVSRILAA
jgi:hypothetical protein